MKKSAEARYYTMRQVRLAAGTWKPWAPIDRAERHVRDLRARGMSLVSIARASGVSLATVEKLVYPGSHRRSGRIRSDIEALVLAVRQPPIDTVEDARWVSSIGTVRRIRALQAIGWSLKAIGAEMGCRADVLSQLCMDQQHVSAARARAVREVYERLQHTRGPGGQRSASIAARHHWAPPAAWDDGAIDDPDAVPQW